MTTNGTSSAFQADGTISGSTVSTMNTSSVKFQKVK